MKALNRIGIVFVALTLIGGASLPLFGPLQAQNRPGLAEEKLEQARQKQQEVKARVQNIKDTVASKSAELKLRREANQERIKEKLAGVKLRTCQQRQERIAQHTTRATERAERLLQKMESIATKAVGFKDSKGVTVEGLEDLETEMDARRAAVESALEAAVASAQEFDCESDGPKAQLQQFVEAMDLVRSALKDYRDTIHEYIQTIYQSNGQHRDSEASSSATPNPEATGSTEENE